MYPPSHSLQSLITGHSRKFFVHPWVVVAFPLALTLSAQADPLADSLDGSGLVWTTGGDAVWAAQTIVSNDGIDAARSGIIAHSKQSWIETTVTGPGTLDFSWKVSSEQYRDYLELSLDGDNENYISGEVDWKAKSLIIEAGTHTIRWQYFKNSSVSEGADAGWVDKVSFVPDGPVATRNASSISLTNATLNGLINPSGLATTAVFEYGLTTAYGNSAAVSLSPNNGLFQQYVNTTISGLTAETTYHFRLIATNSSNPAPGVDRTFTTAAIFEYAEDNGKITITGYNGIDRNIVIPATLAGLPVTRIGSYAFEDNRNLVSIVIPDSVTEIGYSAFYQCNKLTTVTLPTGLLRIGFQAFYGCANLTMLTLPSGVTSIEESAFSGCAALTSIIIPSGVGIIDDNLFSGCSSLVSVTIPEGITYLGVSCFSNCVRLMNLVIPRAVTIIENGAFDGCNNLASITVDPLNLAYSSQGGVIFNKSKTVLIKYPALMAGNYVVPGTVTTISSDAFASCQSLTGITIPNSVNLIGGGAFADCFGLLNVALPTGLTSISSELFSGCSGLTSVVIPNNVTAVGSGAFSDCINLVSISIPSSVNSIASRVFDNCGKLLAFTIPVNTSSIGYAAFRDCRSLTTLSIPKNVTEINEDVFSGCSNLSAIQVDILNANYSSVTGILFNKNQSNLITMPGGFVGSYVIPVSVTSIKTAAFRNCRRLTAVTIPGSVEEIPSSCFRNCSSLVNVFILNGVTLIANDAFAYCSKLSNLSMPDSIKTIEERAFSGCISLTSVRIPRNVDIIRSGAFAGSGLTQAYFLGNAPFMGEDVFESVGNGVTSYFLNSNKGFWFWSSRESAIVVGINSFAQEISIEKAPAILLADAGSSVSLGETPVNVAITQVFTIKNIGHSDLVGLSIIKDGANAADFTITVNPATTVAGPAGSTSFTVSFKPSTVGTRTAALHIASNDSDESPYDISLTGSGIAAEIAVTQGVGLTDGKSKVNYGKLKIKAKVVKTFTITNQGTAPLTGLSVIKSGANAADFTVAALGATTLAKGSSTTFKVTFKATAKGSRRATIKIMSNDADENPFDIALIGVVTGPAKSKATLALHGSPSTEVNSSSDRAFAGYDLIDGRKYLTLTVDQSHWENSEAPIIEVSSDLLAWSSGSDHTEIVIDSGSTLKVRDQTPTTSSAKRYIQLKKH